MSARDDYDARCKRNWIAAIGTLFSEAPPRHAEWQGLDAIIATLRPFLGHDLNHAHLPTGGGMDVRAASRANERGFIALAVSDRCNYIGRPASLAFEYIPADPSQSFLLLRLRHVPETGVYGPSDEREREELTEVAPGQYLDRATWDEGMMLDETGDRVDLPEDAKLIVRFLRGSILFVSRGSMWNGHRSTYDGEHDTMSPDRIRSVIEGWMEQRAARAVV